MLFLNLKPTARILHYHSHRLCNKSLKRLFSSMSVTNDENVREFKIEIPNGFIAAKEWNANGKNTPILALHGWMDNAGTWDHLCPLLDKDHRIVAFDAPGHGLSSSPALGGGVYVTDNVVTIHRVLQYLQWKKVILLGHSMGGGASMLYTGAMPESVHKLILIDLLKPIHVDPEDQPERTSRSLETLLENEAKLKTDPPRYEYTEILDKLLKSYAQSLTEDAAKTLLKRGSYRHEDGKYSFSHSPMIRTTSTLSMTMEQQEAFASNITCDFLLIKALSAPYFASKKTVNRMINLYKKHSKNFQLEVVKGSHHVHLIDPSSIAQIINDFLKGLPQNEKNKKATEEYIMAML